MRAHMPHLEAHINSERLRQHTQGLHKSSPDGVLELKEVNTYPDPGVLTGTIPGFMTLPYPGSELTFMAPVTSKGSTEA